MSSQILYLQEEIRQVEETTLQVAALEMLRQVNFTRGHFPKDI